MTNNDPTEGVSDVEGKRARGFLSKIRLNGVAGVDFPAHMHEGWLVMKSAGDEVRTAVEEAVRPERERIAADRATVEEVKEMVAANQRALDELQMMVNGSIQKSTTDTRDEVVDLVEKVNLVQKWVGFGSGQEAARPKVGSGVEAARIFWGVADE